MPPFIFGRSNVVQTLRFENGTEQQPGLAFKSNPASGLFEENGNVCVSVSGTKVMTVHAGGLSTNAIVCDSVNGSSYSQLTVTSVQITDSSYNAIDDTALSTTSTGYFTMGGNGFGPGTVVKVGDILASSTAFVSTTELRVSVSAQATGTYTLTVIRGDLATATLVNGITFSPIPAWSTSSALGNVSYATPFSFQLAASDALVYSNTTPLPPSTTLSSGGLLEGNIVENVDATYSFIVDAADGEFQNALRTFSLVYSAPVIFVDGVQITNISHTLSYTSSSPYTLTGYGKVRISLWGAAGGNGSYTNLQASGAGGYVRGEFMLQSGTTYYIYVGQGGFGPSTANLGVGGLGGWPNGGYGTTGDATGAGGGGMSMISTAQFPPVSDQYIVLIAGGGGGSTGYSTVAGAGGGTTGQSGGVVGSGGTQSSGGTYNGSRLQGGNATGSRTSGTDDGGGGGGGYYGGGGGTSDARPGGGGSGYINSTLVSNGYLQTGSGTLAPDPDGLLPPSTSHGKTDIYETPQNGWHGFVHIQIVS